LPKKLEAITTLGFLNSRMKDYYDIAILARMYSFDAGLLIEAVKATFRNRETLIEIDPPGLTEAYSSDPARSLQWRAFVCPDEPDHELREWSQPARS
jgi:hypothetical protein